MNLDGGGSTNLFANGKTINRPSDATGPRPVVSAVLIRDRYKKKSTNLLVEEWSADNLNNLIIIINYFFMFILISLLISL